MNELNFTPFPNLRVNEYSLRQLTLEDQQEIFILRSDERILKYLDIPRATELEDARTFIIKINAAISNNESIYWGICKNDDPKLMGTICLWNFSKTESKADIGFVLMPEYQGVGIMQKVIPAVFEYGFNKLNLSAIEGEVASDNIKSIKLLEKFGFVYNSKLENTDIYTLTKKIK